MLMLGINRAEAIKDNMLTTQGSCIKRLTPPLSKVYPSIAGPQGRRASSGQTGPVGKGADGQGARHASLSPGSPRYLFPRFHETKS